MPDLDHDDEPTAAQIESLELELRAARRKARRRPAPAQLQSLHLRGFDLIH